MFCSICKLTISKHNQNHNPYSCEIGHNLCPSCIPKFIEKCPACVTNITNKIEVYINIYKVFVYTLIYVIVY